MKKRRPRPDALLRRRIEKRARRRCEYCHAPQRVAAYRFHLDHVIPKAHGGTDAFAKRALACAPCNLAKLDRITGIDERTEEEAVLFNPRLDVWEDHFRWADDRKHLVGRTPVGRATIAALDMNNELRHEARELWFATGWLP